MEKSIILPWNKENIEKAPNVCGVLMLRTTPVNGDIVFINISLDIKKDFLMLFDSGAYPEVEYFDWLPTSDETAAKDAEAELKKKYHLIDISN